MKQIPSSLLLILLLSIACLAQDGRANQAKLAQGVAAILNPELAPTAKP